MKVVLSLALLGCFIGGIVGDNCLSCTTVKGCFCDDKVKEVIKANITSEKKVWDEKPNFFIYKIDEMGSFFSDSGAYFERVAVKKSCGKNLQEGVKYVLMGKARPEKPHRVIEAKWAKKWNSLTSEQKDFLDEPDCEE